MVNLTVELILLGAVKERRKEVAILFYVNRLSTGKKALKKDNCHMTRLDSELSKVIKVK